jgi:hypothetical protein
MLLLRRPPIKSQMPYDRSALPISQVLLSAHFRGSEITELGSEFPN